MLLTSLILTHKTFNYSIVRHFAHSTNAKHGKSIRKHVSTGAAHASMPNKTSHGGLRGKLGREYDTLYLTHIKIVRSYSRNP